MQEIQVPRRECRKGRARGLPLPLGRKDKTEADVDQCDIGGPDRYVEQAEDQ